MKVSKRCAQAVRSFLVANGVPQSQLELIKPQDTTGAAGKDQRKVRRVDAYIVDDNAIPATGTTTVTTVASPAK